MIKKIILIIGLIFFSCPFYVCAKTITLPEITVDSEFYTYADHKDKVAEILNFDTKSLETYIHDSKISYLALNENNTKQIRLTFYQNDFSNEVINLSNISDSKITELSAEITGFNAKGEIITKNNQKFIKTQVKSTDSGGEYLLTQYFTVFNKQNFVLLFYTDIQEDTQYIEKAFESYSTSEFFTVQDNSSSNTPLYTVATFCILFGVVCVVIIISFFKKPKNTAHQEGEL